MRFRKLLARIKYHFKSNNCTVFPPKLNADHIHGMIGLARGSQGELQATRNTIDDLLMVEMAVLLHIVVVHVEQRADRTDPVGTLGLEEQNGPSRSHAAAAAADAE